MNNILEFKLDKVNFLYNKTIIYGPSSSGRTTILCNILNQLKLNINECVIVTKRSNKIKTFKNILPLANIFLYLNDNIVNFIYEKYKEYKELTIILDKCCYEDNWIKYNKLKELYLYKQKITFFIINFSDIQIPTNIRLNTTFHIFTNKLFAKSYFSRYSNMIPNNIKQSSNVIIPKIYDNSLFKYLVYDGKDNILYYYSAIYVYFGILTTPNYGNIYV